MSAAWHPKADGLPPARRSMRPIPAMALPRLPLVLGWHGRGGTPIWTCGSEPESVACLVVSPFVKSHRTGTGLGWWEAVPAPATGQGRGRGRRSEGPVTEQAGLGFGGLLRQLRDEAGLTQEELAEAARVSQRAVSDLERGINRTARKDTALLLADALSLSGPTRELFIAAARGRAPAAGALAAVPRQARAASPAGSGGVRGFPAARTSFIGREAAMRQVAGLLEEYRLVTVTGAGGSGKTRLAGEG